MNFNEYSVAPCVIPPSNVDGSTGQCAGTDPRCLDLEWAANHPETCPGAATITGFEVVPTASTVEVGGASLYTARLVFSNGKTKDVTYYSTWSTSDTSISAIEPDGLARGIAVGTTTIQATYLTYVDFAQITVVNHCVQAGLDIVLVFDRSAGMSHVDEGGMTELDRCKLAARALVESATLTSGKDKISVVSCAGTFRESTTQSYDVSATVHMILSSVKEDILAAIDSITLGNCYYDMPGGGHGSECATGIGGGLEKAKDELVAHGRANSRKIILYVGRAYEVYCDPDPIVIAQEIQALNIQIGAIAIGEEITYSPCYTLAPIGSITTWDYARMLVTCDLFWGVEDLADLPTAFASVIHTVCTEQNSGCIYYVAPTVDPPPVTRYRDQLDYNGLKNWTVIDGFVDLIGIDLWPLQPGHGLFLDMVGTDLPAEAKRDRRHAIGTIQSKQAFTFGPGRYRLTFDLAGNLRFACGPMYMKVTIPGLLDQIVTVNDWQQEFETYTFDFSTASSASGTLTFAHQPVEPGWVTTVGLLLDNIRLVNLDTDEVMLDDDFNSENPL